jgi:antitoxin component YwqK of YwqJK toxin-antitoxin module
MYVYIDNSIHEIVIVYDADEALTFIFSNDTGHVIKLRYYAIKNGGHLEYIDKYQDGRLHGTCERWYAIQYGGNQEYIKNYKNGKKHGVHQVWWYMVGNHFGHIHCIKNYQNSMRVGIHHYWDRCGTYYKELY